MGWLWIFQKYGGFPLNAPRKVDDHPGVQGQELGGKRSNRQVEVMTQAVSIEDEGIMGLMIR